MPRVSLNGFEKKKKAIPPRILLFDFTGLHQLSHDFDTDQHFSMFTTKEDLIGNMRIKDCIDNQLLYESLKLQLKHEIAMDSLNTMKKIMPLMTVWFWINLIWASNKLLMRRNVKWRHL